MTYGVPPPSMPNFWSICLSGEVVFGCGVRICHCWRFQARGGVVGWGKWFIAESGYCGVGLRVSWLRQEVAGLGILFYTWAAVGTH